MTANKRSESLAVVALGFCVVYFAFPTTYLLLVAAFIAFSTLIPPLGDLILKAWFGLGHALGWVNGKILLSVVWFFILTPIALLYRMRKKDPLRLQKPEGNSNFIDRDHQFEGKDLENPW